MQAYQEGDVRSLGARELLTGQGASLVVFHPGSRTLYLGLGSDTAPLAVPQCIAYWDASLEQQQQQKRDDDPSQSQQQQQPGGQARPAAAAAAGPAAAHYSGKGPGAAALGEAGRLLQLQLPPPGRAPPGVVIREREVGEGEDGFVWADTAPPPPFRGLQRQQQDDVPPSPGQQQQQQEKEGHAAAEKQDGQEDAAGGSPMQRDEPENKQRSAAKQPVAPAVQQQQRKWKGCVVGEEVLRLPPDAPYRVSWPMAGGRIAGAGPAITGGGGGGSAAASAALDALEEIWRTGLRQLGAAPGRWGALDAVLVVPPRMTANEVRLLADLILGRLGFRSLAAHLEPVAATFGVGASAAAVVDIGPEATSVTCVEDGIVASDAGCATLAAGGDAVARTLAALLRAHGAWPAALEAAAAARAGGQTAAEAADWQLLAGLRDTQSYCVKASSDPGLTGERLLEDSGPAELPLRVRGRATRVFSVPTSPWDCIAPLALFLPALDPAAAAAAAVGDSNGGGGAAVGGVAAAGDEAALDEQAGARPVVLPGLQGGDGTSSGSNGNGAGGDGGGDAMEVDGSEAVTAGGNTGGTTCRTAPPMVEEAPPAERFYLAGQAKALAQQQADQPGGEGGAAAAPPLPPVSAYLLGPCAPEPPPERTPLDEAIVRCIDAVAGGRIELRQRLLAGILVTGDAAGIRGLQGFVERCVAGRVAMLPQPAGGVGLAATQPPMINVLETRGDPRTTAWRGAAILAALDSTASGREGWLQRRQWALDCRAGDGPPHRASASANRHAKLFQYLRSQQGG